MNKTVFYEIKHGIGADYFTVERNSDFSFPLHMHRCYEIILLLEGSMRVRIEGQEYRISGGDMIIVKPNRIHSLETVDSSRHILCIFSPELISAVSERMIRYKLTSPVLKNIGPSDRELFMKIEETANIARVKGFLYLICGLFYDQLDLTQEDNSVKDMHLLRDIFLYVESNSNKPCSLEHLAETLGYSPAYLSCFFRTNVGMSYSAYVRSVKMNRACYLLRNTEESIIDISLKCGYVSISSFNRNFRQITGYSPTDYRANEKRNTKSEP